MLRRLVFQFVGQNKTWNFHQMKIYIVGRDRSGYGLSQWEMTLHISCINWLTKVKHTSDFELIKGNPLPTHTHTHSHTQPIGCSCQYFAENPDCMVYGANMGPTQVLSAPGGPHVGLINLVIRELSVLSRDCAVNNNFTPFCQEIIKHSQEIK